MNPFEQKPSIFRNIGTILGSAKDILTVQTTRLADVMEHQADKSKANAEQAKAELKEESNS